MKSRTLALLLVVISGCSLFGEPANTAPAAGLSKAVLTAACTAKSSPPAQEWMSCTALSQATFVCNQIKNGGPVDAQILKLIELVSSFIPDPQLNGIVAGGTTTENAALASWCGD